MCFAHLIRVSYYITRYVSAMSLYVRSLFPKFEHPNAGEVTTKLNETRKNPGPTRANLTRVGYGRPYPGTETAAGRSQVGRR